MTIGETGNECVFLLIVAPAFIPPNVSSDIGLFRVDPVAVVGFQVICVANLFIVYTKGWGFLSRQLLSASLQTKPDYSNFQFKLNWRALPLFYDKVPVSRTTTFAGATWPAQFVHFD